jgi:thiamine pyrophosphokinase
MSLFAILLGGDLTVTPRLRRQLQGARYIAADSGMMHAAALGITPELWVGDFDSAVSELRIQYKHVPHATFPADKAATDGALAIAEARQRGATAFVLAGGLGGQADHMLGHLGQMLALVREGFPTLLTSGHEEAHALLAGRQSIALAAGERISIIPFADLVGLDLHNVKWPLQKRDVPLGSTLTLSNVAAGPVAVGLQQGYGVILAYPGEGGDD